MLLALLLSCSSEPSSETSSATGTASTSGTSSGGTTSGGSTSGGTSSGGGTTGGTSGTTGEPVSALTAVVNAGMGSVLDVTWTQGSGAATWLEFSFDEGEWWSSPSQERGSGAASDRVLGAPFDAEVTLRVAWEGGQSEEITATTGPLPDGAPVPVKVSGDAERWDTSSRFVLTCMAGASSSASLNGSWAFIIDRQGRAVWAVENDRQRISLHTQLSADGTSILMDQNSFWAIFDQGAAATVDELDLTGGVLQTWETPGAHHPFTQLSDGSLAWGSAVRGYGDEELTVLSPDGETEVVWSCGAFLEASDAPRSAYCGSNTLYWHEETDSFLYSLYSVETMIEIDHKTGETLRVFGHLGDDAWDFDPPESAFWWQHGGHYTDHGTLLVSSKVSDGGRETVLREYALDESTQTLVEVFSFGEGEGVYGDTMGEADYTAGGHILHNYGASPRLREITPEGEVVWDVQWRAEYIGRSTPITDLYSLQ